MKMDVVGKGLWWQWWWVVGAIFIQILSPTSSFCPPLCSCDDATLLTDCHDARNLKMVPIFLNPQTRFLSLSQNQIKEISMSLQFYSELQLLDFSQNQIESLGRNNFENLRNLKVLNVSYNSVRMLEPGAFSGLSRTTILDLTANQIESIDRNAFSGLAGLRELHLDRNRIDVLDWDLFSGLLALERLTLRFNFIRILQPPRSFLSFLPNNSNNGSGENEKLLPLTSLTPASNSSGGVEVPWNLRNILEVDLSWNQLAAVRNFGLSPLLPSLRTLNLCCNYIHTIEENAFSSFPQAHSQSVNNGSQVGLSGLSSVSLSQNRLTTIPSEALEKVGSSLLELDLSSNRISDDLPAAAFRSLFQLRRLKVSENPGIRRVDPNAFLDNIHLVQVEANHLPNLTEFPVGLLNNKPYLERMSLQFAQITTLPQELFDNPIYSAQISSLDLWGNPIDCNCSVWKLFQHVVEEEHLVPLATQAQRQEENPNSADEQREERKMPLGSIQCVSPSSLQQLKIRDLSQSDFQHCFQHPSFHHEYFELLVILLAVLIVFLIITAVGIKLCCIYRLCPNQKQQKDSDLPCGKNKESTTLDEFCSNVGLGGVCGGNSGTGSVATSGSGGKLIVNGHGRDYNFPVPPSPALSCRSKNNGGTLPNGSSLLFHGKGPGNPLPPLQPYHNVRTTTLGPRVPVPYDYEDEEGYNSRHLYMTINHRGQPNQATLTNSNKLRFNPKMQLILDDDQLDSEYPERRPRDHHQQPPPLILHYEYDHPDSRRTHGSRYKQVPSVLV